jgi:hypothetical protein
MEEKEPLITKPSADRRLHAPESFWKLLKFWKVFGNVFGKFWENFCLLSNDAELL